MTTSRSDSIRRGFTSTRVQTAAFLLGVVFLLVGVLGFVPGITSNLDRLASAGHESGANLFGLFQVSVLHNLIHVAFGVVGIVAARWAFAADFYLLLGGFVYLGLWVGGLVMNEGGLVDLIPLNTADNWLHFALGVGMIMLGVVLTRGRRGGLRVPTPRQ